MKFFSPRLTLFALLIGGVFFLSSCISNTDNDVPSRIQLGLEIQNLDSTYTLNSDSIYIDRLRLIHGQSSVHAGQDSSLLNSRVRSVEFDQDAAQPANPRSIGLQQLADTTYQSLAFEIPKAPQNSSQFVDPDFTDGGRYTIIANGTYNGESFTFKSSKPISKTFNFSPPLNPEPQNTQYTYLVETDLFRWFVDSSGSGLLDPRDSENAEMINSNIKMSLQFGPFEPQGTP